MCYRWVSLFRGGVLFSDWCLLKYVINIINIINNWFLALDVQNAAFIDTHLYTCKIF